MTINYVQEVIIKAMKQLELIDFINIEKRRENQKQVNKAYKMLDNFNDELVREKIKNKQKKEEGTNE